jgi:hypothetical protein
VTSEPSLLATLFVVNEKTVEQLKECKQSRFPACLEHAITEIFSDKRLIVVAAENAGFKTQGVNTYHDVWEIYLNFLSSLNDAMGKDVGIVIESKTLEDIEAMGCVQCPIYKMETQRKKENYSEHLPTGDEFSLRND